jgi:hypothetical protein
VEVIPRFNEALVQRNRRPKKSTQNSGVGVVESFEPTRLAGEAARVKIIKKDHIDLRDWATGIDIPDRSVIYRICPDHPTLKFVGDCLKVA